MSTYTYPGVYIEELPSGVHTITGVATSIAAFVGWAAEGPTTQASLVQSWTDYAGQFGGLDSRSRLGYAVNQFFGNGGQQCYVVRLVWDGTLTPASGPLAACATAGAAGIGYGTVQITAALGSVSGSITLGIGPPVLQSIAITPATLPPMPIGATVQLTAAPTYSDGGGNPALAAVQWASSDPTILSVTSGGGLATANKAGTVTVTAVSGPISGSTTIAVTAATLVANGLTVTPPTSASPSVAVGQTLQFSANTKYSDGTNPDVTASVAWTSDTPANATVGSAGGSAPPGLVSGLQAGSTGIHATVPWQSGGASPTASTNLTVGQPAVVSVAIYPASPVLPESHTQQLNVWGMTSSPTNPGPTELIGAPWNWSWNSSNTQVATISGSGVVTTNAVAGSTTITATSADGKWSASTTLTVTAATLNAITLSPPTLSIAKGLSQQLTATGIYSDGTTADLSASATWVPGADVTVTPGGLATGTAVGTSSISASWQTANSTASVTVTVTPAVPASITVTAAGGATSIPSGGTPLQLTATAAYSDQSPAANVSTSATWTSSVPSAVLVSSTGSASAMSAGGSLTLFARNPGAWGNNLRVSVAVPPPPSTSGFSLLVQEVTPSGQLTTLESFANLSVDPSNPMYVVTVIDNDSNYVTFINPGNNLPVVPSAAPAATPNPIALSGGADGAVLVPTDQNFELALLNSPGGVFLLDRVDIFNLLCIPGETDAPTISQLQEYCSKKRAFFIVDAPLLSTTSNLIGSGPVGSTPGSITGTYAANSAFYYPWIQAPNPLAGNRTALFPPCGFVAGIYASTDASRGVWKAPAGIGAGLTGESGLQYVLTDLENGSLNIQAVNCLRNFKVYGDVVWGARTLAGNDQAGSEWKYVPIRRFALFLESSLYDGTQWVVFEPNDETLWGQVRLNVGAFLQGLFLQGAFAGTTPQQAYFVKCDGENNPPASVAQGIVNILVGFAPLYPAEFVVIQIQQIAQT